MNSEKHNIPPVYNQNSRILILGSFPSVKSREIEFFYGHKQNRFWKVLSIILNEKIPETTEDKIDLLLKKRIALWDVISQCEIDGSSDSTIKCVKPNDLSEILNEADIKQIFVNGKTAEKYYKSLSEPITGISSILLPSTSPANASKSVENLVEEWKIIAEYLKKINFIVLNKKPLQLRRGFLY